MYNSSDARGNFSSQTIDYSYLILLTLPVVTVGGNILVILAVMTNLQLKQSVTNRYISALAFCDLLVGGFVMPFAVYVKIHKGNWNLGAALCKTFLACDVAASTASILHLVVISIDRYFAVMYPAEYQRYSRDSNISFAVLLIWLISITLTIPILAGKSTVSVEHCWLENPEYMIYSSFLSFYIPAFVLTMMYVKLFKKIRKRKGIREALRQFPCGASTAPFGLPLAMVRKNEESAAAAVGRKISQIQKNGGKLLSAAVPAKLAIDDSPSIPSIPTLPPFNNGTLPKSDSSRRFDNSDCTMASSALPMTNSYSAHATQSTLLGIDEFSMTDMKGRTRQRSITVHSFDFLKNNLTCIKSIKPANQNVPTQKLNTSTNVTAATLLTRPRLETVLSAGDTSLGGSSLNDSRYDLSSSVQAGSSWEKVAQAAANGYCGYQKRRHRSEDDEAGSLEAEPGNVPNGGKSAIKRLVKGFSSAVKKIKETTAVQKERKATKLVAVVLGVFIICWVPFFSFNVARGLCLSIVEIADHCDWIPTEIFFFTSWLGYANSSVNPFIYALVNTQFRNTYKKLLHLPLFGTQSSKNNFRIRV